MLTVNEKKVLKVLIFSFGEDYSINEISRKCSIAPNGALKILRKLEKEGILTQKKIANINSYKINFDNIKTKNIIELSLIQDLSGKIKNRYLDLEQLKEITQSCILFGSYVYKDSPNDLDLIFIIEKKKLDKYRELSRKLYVSMPIKVHDIIQTKEDFINNIKIKDPVIIKSLREGIILWGHSIIIEAVENAR